MANAVRFTSTQLINTPGMVAYLEYHFTPDEREQKMRDWWPGAPDAAYKKLANGEYEKHDDTLVVLLDVEVAHVEACDPRTA